MVALHFLNVNPENENSRSAIVGMEVTIESTSAIDARLRKVIRNDIEELTNTSIYKQAMSNSMACDVIGGSN
jgi:hypothetical protein